MKRIILIGLLVVSGSSFAHGGRTDANGCHTNRKTGEYHCHGGAAHASAAAGASSGGGILRDSNGRIHRSQAAKAKDKWERDGC
jgi:hypothetical protein